jgi:integrase
VATKIVRKFTDPQVRDLKPEAARYIVRGPDGLGVRVSPTGRKVWVYSYRLKGKPGLMNLGDAKTMNVADAKHEHSKALALKNAGISPAATAAMERAETLTAPTVRDLASDFIARYSKPRKRTWGEDQRLLEREVVDYFGDMLARDVRRRDVVALLDRIVARGAPIQANRTLAVLRKAYNWAISRDIVEANPCSQVSRPAKENERDRVLRGDELGKFVSCAFASEPKDVGHAVRLGLLTLLATGQRAGEVSAMEWQDVDLESAVWTIPASKAKNGLAHRVPLSPFAVSLLEEADRILRTRPRNKKIPRPDDGKPKSHVFPSTRGDRPMDVTALNHAIRRRREAWKIAEPFRAHDLRRTCATGIADLGFSRFVIGRILNHQETGVTRIYDRATYDAEKRQALDAWGAKLESLARGEEKPALAVVKGGKT